MSTNTMRRIAIALLGIAVATSILRARIGPASAGESREAYWTLARHTRALTLYAVLEGAALMNVIGFFLTGQWSSVAVFFLAIIMSILFRPGILERN